MAPEQLNELDRKIINTLQDGFPVTERPYAVAAEGLGTDEGQLLERLQYLLDEGVLTRFGPMYQAERLGGAFSLVAMRVPEEDFDRVADIVNGFKEVAHNYQRDHSFNMWFVLATEKPEAISAVLNQIEQASGYVCHNMPKLDEYFVRLKLSV